MGTSTTSTSGLISDPDEAPGRWRIVLRLLPPLLLVAILATSVWLIGEDQVRTLVDRLEGPWRMWAMPGLVVVGSLLTAVGFPGTIVSLTAGAAFGFVLGLPLAIASAFLAATLTATTGRRFAGRKDDPRAPAAGRAWMQRVRLAIGDADWRFVALLRLTPVLPYAMVNWMLGTWHVPWSAIIVGTALGMLPGTAAHVYLGTAGRRLMGGGELHPLEWILLGIGLTCIPLTGWLFARMVRRRAPATEHTDHLDQTEATSERAGPADGWAETTPG